MSEYQRAYIPGGHYFFTLVTHQRRPLFAKRELIERLGAAFRYVKFKHPFAIEAIVVLPDHLHTLWKLPDGDADFSGRWRLIKHKFSIGLDVPKNRRGEKLIWQRRFWERLIRDETDWANHMDYVHYNPVKHGFVQRPADWQYSSFARCVANGLYEETWGATTPDNIRGMSLE